MSVCRNLRGDGLWAAAPRYHQNAGGAPFSARRIVWGQLPRWGRGSLMALFDRKSKGARAASGAVRVPPTASRHDGNTAGRNGRRRAASASPAAPAERQAAPARRVSTGSPYETGSYGAVDARDAEAQVYARRRREQARRDTLRVVAIAAVAVVVLIVVLVVAGVLG